MMMLLAAAIPLLFFGCLALSAWYVDSRLRVLFGLTSRWQTRVVAAIGIVGIVAAMGVTATSSSGVAGILYVFAGYVFTFYLYLLLALLCLHAIQLVWSPPKALSGAVVLIVAFAVTVFGTLWANSFSVKEIEIRLSGLKDEISVMHISDVHLGHHRGRAYLAKIVEETNRRQPNLVLITGDLVDSNAALLPGVLDPLSDFSAPTYFVGGNHENYIDTAHAFELISRHGVRVLHNELVETSGMQLVGLDYMRANEQTFDMHPSKDARTIKAVMASLPLNTKLPSVLMHHSPVGSQYAAEAGIDLMVAGHTHAGQLFPATLISAKIFPFNRGLYVQGKTQVFVSQGAGTFLQRVRLGTSNEINLLRLRPKN